MPTVSCATVEWSVAHPASSSTGNVPRASTPVSTPTMRSSAQSRSLRSPRRVHARNSTHGRDPQLRRSPSEALGCARPGPNRPVSPPPGSSRPRPPGSDSITRLRSSLALPGAGHHCSRRCSRPSAVPGHRGSRNAQLQGSSPSRRHPVVHVSCERHRSFRAKATASATLWRPRSVHPHS